MGKWYKQGASDCRAGICDPPWQPGHRDHTSYMEGWNDTDRELERKAREEDEARI